MTKLIVAFRNFAITPKNECIINTGKLERDCRNRNTFFPKILNNKLVINMEQSQLRQADLSVLILEAELDTKNCNN
jgi:hypothetical protein